MAYVGISISCFRFAIWGILFFELGLFAYFLGLPVDALVGKLILGGGGALLIDRELVKAETVLGYKVLPPPSKDPSQKNLDYRKIAVAIGVVTYLIGLIAYAKLPK